MRRKSLQIEIQEQQMLLKLDRRSEQELYGVSRIEQDPVLVLVIVLVAVLDQDILLSISTMRTRRALA